MPEMVVFYPIRLREQDLKRLKQLKDKLKMNKKAEIIRFCLKYTLESLEGKSNGNLIAVSEEVKEELDILSNALEKDYNEVIKLLLRAAKPEMLASVET